MDCNKEDTWLDTKISLPSFMLSIIFRWLVATWTVHLSVSAIMQIASAMGSSSTGCCKRKKIYIKKNEKNQYFQGAIEFLGLFNKPIYFELETFCIKYNSTFHLKATTVCIDVLQPLTSEITVFVANRIFPFYETCLHPIDMING